jgi:hypothetical protein
MSDTQHANQPQRPSPQHDPWDLEEVAALGISDDQWERMQQVERLFRNAPMVDAPPDLADKVMLTIASKQFDEMNKPPSSGGGASGGSSRKTGGWQLPGRKLFLLLSAAGGLTFGVLVATIMAQTGVVTDLLRSLVQWVNQASHQVADVWYSLSQIAPSNVLMPALLLSSMLMLGIWAWAMRYLISRRQQVVYHIPVSFE